MSSKRKLLTKIIEQNMQVIACIHYKKWEPAKVAAIRSNELLEEIVKGVG